MNNNKTKGTDFSKANPEFIEQVEQIIVEGNAHRYSASRIYAAHNAAYGLNETPQTCSSCLLARVNKLREWMDGYKHYEKNNEKAVKSDKDSTIADSSVTASAENKKQQKEAKQTQTVKKGIKKKKPASDNTAQ